MADKFDPLVKGLKDTLDTAATKARDVAGLPGKHKAKLDADIERRRQTDRDAGTQAAPPTPAASQVPKPANGVDVADIGRAISRQRQLRHIKDTPDWIKRGQGSYLTDPRHAQDVLDAAHSGRAPVVGYNAQGQPLVRYDGVTGYNNNPGAGYHDQPTHVFIIKGTSSPSVVPTSPTKG